MNENINVRKLFLASRIALIATAMTFAIRANLINPLGREFGISALEMGLVLGTAFWGFAISMVLGGLFCDMLGMKKLIFISFLAHVSGIAFTVFASGFWSLFFSTLLVGFANGMIEATCNPLVATLYPNQKTKKLNQFHVWFPGGIVIGGLVAYFMDLFGWDWKWQLSTILIPIMGYGILFYGESFPQTERVSAGVSTKEMFMACISPLFLFMVGCMLLTAATELGTNQWIVELLENVGVDSILLLVLINGAMMLGRTFAGEVEHRLSTTGMLLCSALFSAIGLILLSKVNGYASFGAALVFALGICYFWPTMLGFVSENLPKTGALGLAVMGSAGMLSVAFILPFIGDFYQMQTVLNLPPNYSLETLANFPEGTLEAGILKKAKLAGGAKTLAYVAILPIFLTLAFTALYFYLKAKNSTKLETVS